MKTNKGRKFPPEILTDDEIDRFFSCFTKSPRGVRNRAMFTLYLKAQLRCQEALDLHPWDIDYETCAITVRCGKGGKRRVVGIDRAGMEDLNAWNRIRDESCEWFLHTSRGTKMQGAYARNLCKRVGNKAKIPRRVHPHAMRHTGACRLAKQGCELRVIQRQLGHTSLNTTQIYLDHLSPMDVVAAVRDISFST